MMPRHGVGLLCLQQPGGTRCLFQAHDASEVWFGRCLGLLLSHGECLHGGGDIPVGSDVLQQCREISSSWYTASSLPPPRNLPDATLALASDPAFPFPQGLEAHKYKNTWDCAYQIMKHEGPLA